MDRLFQLLLDFSDAFRSEAFLRGDAAERYRQAGLTLPPFAEIFQALEAALFKNKAAFVDNYPGIGLARFDGIHDLIEWHEDAVFDFRIPEAEKEVGGGVFAGHGDRGFRL